MGDEGIEGAVGVEVEGVEGEVDGVGERWRGCYARGTQ